MTFKSSRIRTIYRGRRLTNIFYVHKFTVGRKRTHDHTLFEKSRGRVPGVNVMAVLFSPAEVAGLVVMSLKKRMVYETT